MMLFKRETIKRREWGLFGLRWVLPVGALLLLFLTPSLSDRQIVAPFVLISAIAILTNLVLVLLLVIEYWAPFLAVATVVIDALLVFSLVYLTDVRLGWIGLVPALVAGLYFDWIAGLIASGSVTLLVVAVQFLPPNQGFPSTASFAITVLALLAAGPLAAVLADGTPQSAITRSRWRSSRQQAAKISKMADEYVAVVVEMAEVLSASKLDPNRVLSSAVNFGLEGLARVGLQLPLYGMILLFDDSDDGSRTVLRVAQASDTVKPSDCQIVTDGAEGAVAKALKRPGPVVSPNPDSDPEISRYESFRTCTTVLCLPLMSGSGAYGVFMVGSAEVDAFNDRHIELMRVVANQAAASLYNAKLYGSLLVQRDRLVEVEKSAREQLASELHDGPTQKVSAIALRLNMARKLVERDPTEAINDLYQLEDMARRTAKEIRAMLFELRPKSLEQGLEAGLEQLSRQMRETYAQVIDVKVEDHCDQLLDAHAAQVLFSIVAETVHNARKHAEASLIQVHMGIRQDMFVLGVKDDGVGFDVEQALLDARQREGHLGLLSLYERAALLEGTLRINSEPNQGTRLTVAIPLEILEHRRSEESSR